MYNSHVIYVTISQVLEIVARWGARGRKMESAGINRNRPIETTPLIPGSKFPGRRIPDRSTTICIKGRFTFDVRYEFQTLFKNVLMQANIREIRVDLGAVDYIDCAALGLLLLWRDRAKADGKTVLLTGVSGQVSQVLKIAGFAKLFTIT